MSLEIVVLGTGGMLPLPDRHLVSLLIRKNGQSYLFDCGEGTQVALKKAQLRWKKINSIFITHMHADHVTGLPGLLMLSSQVERQHPLAVFGPHPLKDYYLQSKQLLEMHINYTVLAENVNIQPGLIYEDELVQVKGFPLIHSKPCLAYCLEEKPTPGRFYPEKAIALGIQQGPLWSQLQKGQSVQVNGQTIDPLQVMDPPIPGLKISYVTDTAYFPEISDFVKDSDILFIEGMFEKQLIEQARQKKHMTFEQSAQVGKDGNVKQIYLLHFSPRYQNFELKKWLKQAQKIFPDTHLAFDGQYLFLPTQRP